MNRVPMDGFTGALMAVESFADGRAVLHGPGGCRAYHAALSSRLYPRSSPRDLEKYSRQYFFGQARMPCTFVDEDDYIHGSEEKIEECLPIVCGVDGSFQVFVRSPGAALIGDNITDVIGRCGYSDRALAIEESLISRPFSSSYDHTVRSILEWRSPEPLDTIKGTANIIGLPISSNDWPEGLADLTALLSSMGIEVLSSPGAGCGTGDIDRSVSAELNIAVSSEYCVRTAEFYEKEYGIPTVFCGAGAPVGFEAVENWLEDAAAGMGKDPRPALSKVRAARARAFRKISASGYSQRMKCRRFAVMTDSSAALPLTKWLYSYLNMVPASVSVDPGEDADLTGKVASFLRDAGLGDAWGSDPEASEVHFVFSDGHTAGAMEIAGACRKGVDIMAPNISSINMLPRPIYGMAGSMYLLDEIFSEL